MSPLQPLQTRPPSKFGYWAGILTIELWFTPSHLSSAPPQNRKLLIKYAPPQFNPHTSPKPHDFTERTNRQPSKPWRVWKRFASHFQPACSIGETIAFGLSWINGTKFEIVNSPSEKCACGSAQHTQERRNHRDQRE